MSVEIQRIKLGVCADIFENELNDFYGGSPFVEFVRIDDDEDIIISFETVPTAQNLTDLDTILAVHDCSLLDDLETTGDSLQSNVLNDSGVTILAGVPVYITGFDVSSNLITIAKADASDIAKMPAFACVGSEAIEDGDEGIVYTGGQLTLMDTSMFSTGAFLYVASGGGHTNTKPTGTNLVQKMAEVIYSHAVNGKVQIYGAGRENDLPNITTNKVWMGDGSAVPVETDIYTEVEVDDLLSKHSHPPTTHPDPHRLSNGSTAIPAYSFSSDIDTGMYRESNGDLAFTQDGTCVFEITTTNRLIISNQVPNYENLVTTDDVIPNKKYVDDRITSEISGITGFGDVTSALSLADNCIIRGDGGAKGVQTSTWEISDNGQLSSGINRTGYILDVHNTKADGGGNGFRIKAGELAGDIAFHVADTDDTFQIMELEADNGHCTLGKTYATTLSDNGTVYGMDIQFASGGSHTDFNTQNGIYRIGGNPLNINHLSDVDTNSSSPSNGDILEWDGTNWVPGTASGGGVTGLTSEQITGDDGDTSEPMLFVVDTTRSNKKLSVESNTLIYGEASVTNNDWIQMGSASDADSGYIMPYDGTVIRISCMCENTNYADLRIDLWKQDSKFVDDIIDFNYSGNGYREFIDSHTNHDFSKGDRLRMRAVTNGNTAYDTLITIWVKWRKV